MRVISLTMSRMYPVASVRTAEATLLAAQTGPDQLMREAAEAVARTAAAMLDRLSTPEPARILLLVGSGGNGGDALYAGASLLRRGLRVDALPLGPARHEGGARAFLDAGGTFLDAAPEAVGERLTWTYHLAIDGISGLGGRPGLTGSAAWLADDLAHSSVPVLSIDTPSGLPADTGRPPAPREITYQGARRTVPGFITAHVTLTFGGLRRVHGASEACGQVLCADIALPGAPSLATILDEGPDAPRAPFLYRAVPPRHALPALPEHILPVPATPLLTEDVEPAGGDDKYSSGVVGILAGSAAYPGAGLLAASAAVRATPSMVRYVGSEHRGIVAALPEVVATPDAATAGRVQAWVVGPGRGTGEEAAAELDHVLGRPEPVLCDADALTLLARREDLRRRLLGRAPYSTVLTPHVGEFARLRRGMGMGESDGPRWEQAREVAEALRCVVLLKGRFTSIAGESTVVTIDAGHSWAATPGSGDVLSGVLGAWLARLPGQPHRAAVIATHLHAVASRIAAETPYGPAPASASRIAHAVSGATAQELRRYRAARGPWA